MKRYLPIILLLVGILVFAGLYFFVIRGSKNNKKGFEQEEAVAEIPFEKRPVASLTPTVDGHYLNLRVEGIKLNAFSIDYELLYQTADDITQGVPGTLKLSGKTSIEANLLLGSESSGKFRYDQGVSQGTLTLRFRDEKGKLLGKLSTEFHLQSNTKELTSIDGKFKYTLDKTPKSFFVTMETFGVPENLPTGATAKAGPYGVFASDGTHPGKVELEGNINYLNGSSWEALTGGKSANSGIFIGLSE